MMLLTKRNRRKDVYNIGRSIRVPKEKYAEERPQARICDCTTFQDSVVFICATLVYVNTLKGDFLHDDIPGILRNPDVKGLTFIHNVFENDFWGNDIKRNQSHKSYRPLCVLSFRLNYYIHGFNSVYFHLVNVLLHAFVSVLVSVLAREVVFDAKNDRHKTKSFLTGILFAVHPIHTEAVANLVGRAECLSAALYIITIIIHKYSVKSKSRVTEVYSLMLCLLLSGCAMLMKETGVTVLGILFSIEAFELYKRFCAGKRLLTNRHVLTIFVIIAWTSILLYVRFSIMGWRHPNFATPDNPASKSPVTMTRCFTYWYISWINFKLLLLPVNLSYDWSYGTIPLITSWVDYRNVVTLTFIATFTYAILNAVRKCLDKLVLSAETIGFIMLVVPYIPCSNLFFPVGYVIAERTLYIPSIGFSIIIVSLWERCQYANVELRKIANGLLLVLILLYSIKTVQRNADWESKENLFLSGVKTTPQNAKVRYNWANYLRATKRYDEAVQEYQETLKLYPLYPGALNNLATILERNDSTMKEAQTLYTQLIHIAPSRVEVYLNLASLLIKMGQYKSAAKIFVRLMSRRVIPVMNVVPLANELMRHNLLDYGEVLLVLLLREFCNVQSDLRVMRMFNRLIKSGHSMNSHRHCLQDMEVFTKAMTIYASLLDLKGMFKESRVVREYNLSFRSTRIHPTVFGNNMTGTDSLLDSDQCN